MRCDVCKLSFWMCRSRTWMSLQNTLPKITRTQSWKFNIQKDMLMVLLWRQWQQQQHQNTVGVAYSHSDYLFLYQTLYILKVQKQNAAKKLMWLKLKWWTGQAPYEIHANETRPTTRTRYTLPIHIHVH